MSEGHNTTGQIPFRLPVELQAQISQAADWRHMSVNRWLLLATERALAVQRADVQRLRGIEAREQQLDKLFEQVVAVLQTMPGRSGATQAELVEEANSILDGDIPPPMPEIGRLSEEYDQIRYKSGDYRPYGQLAAEQQADQDFLVDLAWDQDEDYDGDYGG